MLVTGLKPDELVRWVWVDPQLPQLEVLCKVGFCEKRLNNEDLEFLMEARKVRELFASAHQAKVRLFTLQIATLISPLGPF